MNQDSTNTEISDPDIDKLRDGDETTLAELFSHYQPSFKRMIDFRIDRRVAGRVDSGDVLQDAYLEISRRLPDFLGNPKATFFVWARQIAWQTLLMAHRSHLEVKKRDAKKEIRFQNQSMTANTSASIAFNLAADITSPSHAAIRDEQTEKLHEALEKMDELDREVLALRHFEQLANKEVADVLGIGKTAASNRYVRALVRLKDIMDGFEKHDD